MPDVGIQIPPNLADWWDELAEAGATDLGGLSANGDHISPEHAFPSPHEVRKRLAPKGYALTERLCVYPQYLEPDWVDQGVLDVVKLKYWSFIPRRGSGRRQERTIDPALAPQAIERALADEPLTENELTALFAERRPEVIEDMRVAADRLRAELAGDVATFVVNRNINFTNVCVVGCAFCGFGQGTPLARRLRGDRGRVSAPDRRGGRVRRHRDLHAGRHPPRVRAGRLRPVALARQGSGAPAPPPRLLADGGALHVRALWALARRTSSTICASKASDSTPGTAAEVLDDGVRARISPNKLPVARWVEIIEASHRAGLRSTSTVMFGHIEEPWELARHMRVIRELQERTGGITEFVPLSFIPFHTMLGRTHGIEEISREENLKHTAAFRLALGRSVKNLQASWVKMGIDAATESLRWGVNDLGGTLMEESISRMAGSQHGDRLDPEDLIGAARAAGRTPAQRTTLYDIVETYPTERAKLPARLRARAPQPRCRPADRSRAAGRRRSSGKDRGPAPAPPRSRARAACGSQLAIASPTQSRQRDEALGVQVDELRLDAVARGDEPVLGHRPRDAPRR